MNPIKLGARILKTGIAVMLAIFVGNLFGLNPVIFAAVAAVLTVQPSVYRSWQHMLEQVKANAIGAIMAIVALYFFGNNPVVVGVVVMIAISVNLYLGFGSTVGIVVLTVLAIMETPHADADSSILFVLNRFTLIMIGILSSITINFLFVPPKYEEKLIEHIIDSEHTMFSFLRMLFSAPLEADVLRDEMKKINEKVAKTEELFLLHKEEINARLIKKKYSSMKKLVAYNKAVTSLKKCNEFTEKVTLFYPHMDQIDEQLKKELEACVHMVILYKEMIMMKLEKKVKCTPKFERNEELYQEGEAVINKMMQRTFECDMYLTSRILPVISSLVEIIDDLNGLDKIVNTLHKRVEK